jgi:hypothetical protein
MILGAVLNLLVTSMNRGKMPVARGFVDIKPEEYPSYKVGGKLLFLGDVIPIRFRNAGRASIGDVLLLAGFLIFASSKVAGIVTGVVV